MDNIALQERKKYTYQWQHEYQRSACALPLVEFIRNSTPFGVKMLEIGCGDGTTVKKLRRIGQDCSGLDITLAGINFLERRFYYEAPAWDMPFEDNTFDFTFSTDVLEHFPPKMIDASIKEIYRITKIKTFHCIATFPHETNGVILHLTVKPIEWWHERFALFKNKDIEVEVISRMDFLKRWANS